VLKMVPGSLYKIYIRHILTVRLGTKDYVRNSALVPSMTMYKVNFPNFLAHRDLPITGRASLQNISAYHQIQYTRYTITASDWHVHIFYIYVD
jgi:hypothetical protein